MLAHVPSFGRNPRGSPDLLAYPVPKACMHVLGTGVPRRLGVARCASSPKAAQALGCSLTPGLRISFGRATCMARAASVARLWTMAFLLLCGFCAWVRLCLGLGFGNPASPGWGLGWVCLAMVRDFAPLFPAGVRGVCGWAWGSACSPPVLVRVVVHAWLCAGSSCSPPFPVLVYGAGVCVGVWVAAAPRLSSGRYCWGVRAVVRVPCLPPPFLGGRLWRRSVRVLLLVGFGPPPSPLVSFGLCGFGRWLFRSWASWSLPPHPFSSGPRCLLFVFCFCFFSVFWVSLLRVGRCRLLPGVASFGWVVPRLPFWGVLSLVPSGWGVWPPLVVLVGGVVAVGRSRAPPPPPCCCCFLGAGSACSSLCLPWTGARTGRHSVWFSGLLLVVAFCRAVARPHGSGGLCTR